MHSLPFSRMHDILNRLNSGESSIQFTVDLESNRKHPLYICSTFLVCLFIVLNCEHHTSHSVTSIFTVPFYTHHSVFKPVHNSAFVFCHWQRILVVTTTRGETGQLKLSAEVLQRDSIIALHMFVLVEFETCHTT